MLLALLYVQHFLAPLILNSVHEWMDNFLPVSFFMLLNYLLLLQLVAVSPLISGRAVAVPGASAPLLSWGGHITATGAGETWAARHPQRDPSVPLDPILK